ncbi:hypothetical protein CVT25_014522 [Psilocybe cyanescens]|uniref:Decapping nuclease n=1 Tax=Psilocybe cyanescens TaxID=93625 RepID=A0A409WR75_PSICY|nr:hypothetical protein CVT25_014522 [Psilocybe cyanescens]
MTTESASPSSRKRGISAILAVQEEEFIESVSSGEPPKTRRRMDESPAQEQGQETRRKDANPPVKQNEETATISHPQAAVFFSCPDVSTMKPKAVPFQQPSQLISFSYTPEHVQEFTDSALRYYVDPPLGSRLNYGYDRWVRKPDDRGRIDALLKAISKVKRDSARGGGLPEIAVVSWRGVMTKILTVPYENRDAWELNVMLVNGTLYLEEHLTEDRLREKNNMDARQRSQTYYGYAFESYCTSETPPGEASAGNIPGAPLGWGGDVDTHIQWCSVVRTKLGDMRMIMGGEVDCVKGKYTGQTDTFVELKTSLTIRGRQDEERFERKLLKFYFQSFLLGVPEIVVGFRTPAGVVTTVQLFKTIQLPRMVRDKPGAWDPLVCLDWASGFLKELTQRVVDDRVDDTSASVWRARFVPGKGVSMMALDAKELEDVVNGEDRVGFLPRWYWDEIKEEVRATSVKEKQMPMPTLANAGWQI